MSEKNFENTKMELKKVLMRLIDNTPKKLHQLIYRILIETRYLFFKIKWMGRHKNSVDPAKIYWISPNRIVKCLADQVRKRYFESEQARGAIVPGDWDITNYDFVESFDVYNAIKKRIEGVDWINTAYYKRMLDLAKSGVIVHGVKNECDLVKRCAFIDSLFENIKTNGYRTNRNNFMDNLAFQEIEVNIGRNGEYIFRDGAHRLAIAKILGIKTIPVMVFARHQKWQEFREFVGTYARQNKENGGKLYQPIVHPDLSDIPYDSSTHDYFQLIGIFKPYLNANGGKMLDIGSNVGFFCNKFEDLGYECFGVERDPALYYIMEKVRIAENKKFRTYRGSIFECEFTNNHQFDVVLALNIFHHFIKTKALYSQFIDFLQRLNTQQLFFEPSLPTETQMKESYLSITERQFVSLVLYYTSLKKCEVIYHDSNGRNIYRLSV